MRPDMERPEEPGVGRGVVGGGVVGGGVVGKEGVTGEH
jgi:hypothetical protein